MGVLRFAELGSSSRSRKIGWSRCGIAPITDTEVLIAFSKLPLGHAIQFQFAVEPPDQR